jgi:hypothetical protein
MQLQHAEGVRQHGWVAAVRAGPHDAGAVAPVAASADASSDEVLPELDAAAARVVAPASGTWHLHWVGISTAVPAVAAACAAAFAAAVAPWHCDGNVAASASAIEAAVSADAEALVARTPIVFFLSATTISAHTAIATAATAVLGALEAWRRKEKSDNDRKTVAAPP